MVQVQVEEIAEDAKAEVSSRKYWEELLERWKKVQAVWRRRYGEVYLAASDKLRSLNLSPEETITARVELLHQVRNQVLEEAIEDVLHLLVGGKSSLSANMGGLTAEEMRRLFLIPVDLDHHRYDWKRSLQKSFDIPYWQILAEARKLWPPRKFLGIRIEKKDPWLD